MRWFSRKPKSDYLTVEDAIAQGIIDPAALQRHYIPRSGVSVKYYSKRQTQDGAWTLVPAMQVWYPSWAWFRNNRRAQYMGGAPLLGLKDIPTGFREPMIDLSAGVTDVEYRAARGFLVDQGLVNRQD